MKAFILDCYGKKQCLRLNEAPVRILYPNHVPFRTEATTLHMVDEKFAIACSSYPTL